MTEIKWTPGEWNYRPHEFDDWGVVKDSTGFTICQARSRTSEEELSQHRRDGTDPWSANAHLIAAAPELYEALEACLAQMRIWVSINGDMVGAIQEKIDAGEKALAKARGEVK